MPIEWGWQAGSGAHRQSVNDKLRRHVMAHDQRIAQATGQSFGQAYFDRLLRDTVAVFDSTPPTTAILAAQEIAGLGLGMLHLIQHAHYVLARLGGQGFTTLALEYGDGRMVAVDLGNWLGRTEAWSDYLRQQLSVQTAPGQVRSDPACAPACGIDGCAM